MGNKIVLLMGWLMVHCVWAMLRAPASSVRQYFATTLSGLESVLVKEINTLHGVSGAKVSKGGVKFYGSVETGLDALMWCRTPLRIMEKIGSAKQVNSKSALFQWISSINWNQRISSSMTLKCDAILGKDISPELSHSHFTALTVKNAIIDQLRDASGNRPSVDTVNPDLPLILYLHRGEAIIYRVWSGDISLHKRGYRSPVIHKAALRETTAASLLLHTDWANSALDNRVLCDPMCGSGTIAIEAALIAADTAPGLIRFDQCDANENRDREGFALYESSLKVSHPDRTTNTDSSQRARDFSNVQKCLPNPLMWPDIDYEAKFAWEIVSARAQQRDRRQRLRDQLVRPCVLANDIHETSVILARWASLRAKVDHMIDFSYCDVASYRPLYPPNIVVTNPPWEKRLIGAEDSWGKLGKFLRGEFGRGIQAFILSGNDSIHQIKGLERPYDRIRFKAAAVDVSFSRYEM